MASTSIGIDLASVDKNRTPKWIDATTVGNVGFVGVRCAYGTLPDDWYPTYRTQLDALGIPNFPYLFLVPNQATPEDQVNRALDRLGVLNRSYFPFAIDVEGDRRGLTPAQWRSWVVRANEVFRTRYGAPAMIYSSQVYWVDPDGMNNEAAPELADCTGWWKLWPLPPRSPAIYDPTVVDQLSPPPTPPPWKGSWQLQQYQGDAIKLPGFTSTVDMNRVHIVKRGDKGESVKYIQKRLPNIAIDGDFGPLTESAVRSFQANENVTADGAVGLDTAQLLAWVTPRAA